MGKAVKTKQNKKRIRHPTRRLRLRVTAIRLGKLLHEDPTTLGKSIELLGQMVKGKRITLRTFYRILNAPLAHTTIKRKLKEFSQAKIHFDQLMESVNNAYSRRVPKKEIDTVIKCKKGHFYEKVSRLAEKYASSKSFITQLTIRRMRYLKRPAEDIAEAERIKWGIHQQAHKWYKAKEKGRRDEMLKRRHRMRELERIFTEKFTKKL